MPDLPDDLDPLNEASFLEAQRAIAKGLSAQRYEEQLELLEKVGKKGFATIDQATELAKDGDPHKAALAALIKDTVIGAAHQMASGRPPAEEARGAAQASPLSTNSPQSTPSLPGSPPKGLTHEPTEPQASPAPKKRGRPLKHPKG